VLKVADVRIKRAEVKFGDGGWDGNGPADHGTLTWKVDDYRPYPVLEGTLYMVNADDLCARMRIKYISSAYGVQDNTYGTERCVYDDAQHTFDIDLGNYLAANSYVDQAKVIIQRRPNGGTWENAGSVLVELP